MNHQINLLISAIKSKNENIPEKSTQINSIIFVLRKDLSSAYKNSVNKLADDIEQNYYDLFKELGQTIIKLWYLESHYNFKTKTESIKLSKLHKNISNILEYRKLVYETNHENNTHFDNYV
jgi:hypothetical protein